VRICFVALALIAARAAAAIDVIDDRGVQVHLDRHASRIVTLAPNLAEIAFAAGAGASMVGVSSFTDFPPHAALLPVVGSNGRTNLEALLRLRPNLVLAWLSGNRGADLERIERLGIPLIVTEAATLADIPRLLRMVGHVAGTQIAAERSAREFETRLALRSHPMGQRLRVFYEIWHAPIMTVNGRHVISEMLSRCGAENIHSDSPLFAGSVSLEQVYARNPDAILVAGNPQEGQLAAWRARTGLRAVRDGRVAAVDPTTLHRMGPRVLSGLEHLCSRIDGFRR